jgi:catechol 2,3-dioxygenase-like lactoylglutathione lyase family enzyme
MNYIFHHVHVTCKDLEKMISFFTDILKGQLVARKEFSGAKGAKISFNGVHVNISVPHNDNPVEHPDSDTGIHHLAFQVENCDLSYDSIKSAGYRFTKPPKTYGNTRTAFFNGPEDVAVEIIQLDPI